jgi:hypothetical protein
MLTEDAILTILDNHSSFINLDQAYSYLIDCRLTVFHNDNEQWAIAVERLGYNPRADAILLDIHCIGNCFNGRETNTNTIMPIDWDSFNNSMDFEVLQSDAKYWIVRGTQVQLSHNKQDYINAGINLKEYEPNEVTVEEACRLAVIQYPDSFRATDEELYQLIPKDLKKVLVLDEWFQQKENYNVTPPSINEEQLISTYEVNKYFSKQVLDKEDFPDYESFAAQYRQNEQINYEDNLKKWKENQLSSYETWQQIAKVIATGDTKFYKPTFEANTHWKFYPESGSL